MSSAGPFTLLGSFVISSECCPQKYLFQTNDPEEAATQLGSRAVPYVSELLLGSPPFSTKIQSSGTGKVRISRVTTTGRMQVHSRLPADCFALIVDLRTGVGLHRSGQGNVSVDSEFGFVQSPLQAVEVVTLPEFDVLFVRLARTAVMQELQKLLGKDAQTDLIFSPAFRMRSTAGLRLREICRSLEQASFRRTEAASSDCVSMSSQEQELISLLLPAQSHNYTRLLNRNRQAGDWQITTAEEFLRSNAPLPISLGDICQASGLNARTLQNCFRKKRGSSPPQFLRTIRMEEARKGLLNPDENTSVTSEAARWGFVHFGRFSQKYRQTFGELPSETLRRSRELCGGAPAALNKISIAIR